MAFELSAPPVRRECAGAGLLGPHDRLRLRQAPWAYVEILNELVAGTDLDGKPLEEVVRAVAGNADARRCSTTPRRCGTTFFWPS